MRLFLHWESCHIDYLALGHIHCPQDIKGSHHHARYCGTPLPVSFDETYPHSVSIIELEKGAEPQISTREIENPIPLVTLPHDPTPFEDALKLLEEYPEEKPAYLRLNVLTKGYLPPDLSLIHICQCVGNAFVTVFILPNAAYNGKKHRRMPFPESGVCLPKIFFSIMQDTA